MDDEGSTILVCAWFLGLYQDCVFLKGDHLITSSLEIYTHVPYNVILPNMEYTVSIGNTLKTHFFSQLLSVELFL